MGVYLDVHENLQRRHDQLEEDHEALKAELVAAKAKIGKLATWPVHRQNEVLKARNTKLAASVATLKRRNKNLTAKNDALKARINQS
jgi:cell division protein FtsB